MLETDAMRHALVIEDNPLIALMLQDHLEARGFETVDVAVTQAQAISFAKERCPHLITADDSLDDGSGVEAIRRICRDVAIPVIVIVADRANVERELPNALLLLKPFSEAALASAIQDAEKAPFLYAYER